MSKFIGCTVGLDCSGNTKWNKAVSKLVRVEYSKNEDGTVTLQAVSGHNGAITQGNVTLTEKAFEERPRDNDKINEARWALNACGWSLMHDDYTERM